jgi:tRNA modification GTPase
MTGTIAALATAPGRAAIAVIRMSGPGVGEALAALGVRRLRPRQAALRTIRSADGQVIDHAVALWFPAPASYTGEDCAELHLHGGPAVVEAAIGTLLAAGLRLAEPGEFTKRAFENGKLDLEQAEAVADLIDAESAAQARQATAQLEGALGERYRAWRARLLEVLTWLEAAIDFPDEAVPADVAERARGPLAALIADLGAALADGARGRTVREGYRIAIIGAPNAGKSSLINALTGRDTAIVTPVAGTTRDVIEAALTLCGYRATVADMAGLRRSADPIESEGVRRARSWAQGANLRIWVVDRAGADADWRFAAELVGPGDLCLMNKADLPAGEQARAARAAATGAGASVIETCLREGRADGVADWLSQRIVGDLGGGEFPATTRARHERLLGAARDHLERAMAALEEPELAAADVRLAGRALAMITGEIGVEDVLGEIFASFCIGK